MLETYTQTHTTSWQQRPSDSLLGPARSAGLPPVGLQYIPPPMDPDSKQWIHCIKTILSVFVHTVCYGKWPWNYNGTEQKYESLVCLGKEHKIMVSGSKFFFRVGVLFSFSSKILCPTCIYPGCWIWWDEMNGSDSLDLGRYDLRCCSYPTWNYYYALSIIANHQILMELPLTTYPCVHDMLICTYTVLSSADLDSFPLYPLMWYFIIWLYIDLSV